MKLLLTSAGVRNPSIRDALVDLLDRPIADSNALRIPTAQYAHPTCGPDSAWRFIAGQLPTPMCDLGWKSVGVLELTTLPASAKNAGDRGSGRLACCWRAGGETTYLGHWMRQSGLADLSPSLPHRVWVGSSAGSMVMTPRIGDRFVSWLPRVGVTPPRVWSTSRSSPHLGLLPDTIMAEAESWAVEIAGPAYAIDDQTAIKVRDGAVEIVSEGSWSQLSA